MVPGDDWRPARAGSPVADASQTWQLRREMDGDTIDAFRHKHLGVVTGTEKGATERLLAVALEETRGLSRPSKGCRVAQEGTTIVVSPVRRGWDEGYDREYRFTAHGS